jgi:hypothetical protein
MQADGNLVVESMSSASAGRRVSGVPCDTRARAYLCVSKGELFHNDTNSCLCPALHELVAKCRASLWHVA